MDTEKVKWGCGGVALAICAGFALMMWWYSRPESQEDRDKRILESVRNEVQLGSNRMEEASIFLSRQDYSMAYNRAVYETFNARFLSDVQYQYLEYEPGKKAKDWVDAQKKTWRQKVNEEFDRQAALFARRPLEAAANMEALAGQYRDYTELKTKLDVRRKDIDEARAREAAGTFIVYLPLRDYMKPTYYVEGKGTPPPAEVDAELLECMCLSAVSNALAARWTAVPGVKLRFTEQPAGSLETDAAWEYITAEVSVARESYVTKQNQLTSTRIASGLSMRFLRKGGRNRSTWSELPVLEAHIEAPDTVSTADYNVRERHEKRLLDEFTRQFTSLPAFKPLTALP